MNLNMIQPNNETKDLLLSITKRCELLNNLTHAKPEETLEYKTTKPRETFFFESPISIKGSWMPGLTALEVYISVFEITEETNELELYTDDFDDKFSFFELKDKAAELLGLSHISPEDLQREIHGPDNIKTYRKLSLENSQTGG